MEPTMFYLLQTLRNTFDDWFFFQLSLWNFTLCSRNLLLVVKVFLQSKHWEKVLPSPWVAFMWCFSGVASVYDLVHNVHLKSLCFRWDALTWSNILDLIPNFFEHNSQCISRILSHDILWLLRLNTDLKHLSHFIFFFPPCLVVCSFKESLDLNTFWQMLHLWLSCEWVSLGKVQKKKLKKKTNKC